MIFLYIWLVGWIIWGLVLIGEGEYSSGPYRPTTTQEWVEEIIVSFFVSVIWFIHIPVLILKKLFRRL